jgi:hypothetical protein
MMKFKYGPYSPSRLDTGVCGFAFNKRYIEKRQEIESLPAARGSAIHEVLEKVTKRLVTGNCVFNADEVRAWVVEAVNNHPTAYQEVDSITDMVKLYVQRPPSVLTEDAGIELRLAIKPKMVGDKIATYLDDKVFPGQPIERILFEECDYNDPDAWARGRADILVISDDTTTAIVYDHKTQPNVEEADTFQMGFYAWVISRIYPFLNEIHTVLHFARYGKYSDPYVWTQQDLNKIEEGFLTRASIIENRAEWSPTPHNNCQYCAFILECPTMREYVQIDDTGAARVSPAQSFRILGDQNKAVKIAGVLNVLEEAVSVAKDELREFVKEGEGRVAIPGKIYEYRASDGINWDKVNTRLREDTYAIFEKHGVDPKSFMSFNQTASKTIWLTENEALVKELANLFPRKTETRFAGYKS